jgi:hypothetical protein
VSPTPTHEDPAMPRSTHRAAVLTLGVALAAAPAAYAHEGHGTGPSLDPAAQRQAPVRAEMCKDSYRIVRGQGRSCRVQGGLWKVQLRDGSTYLTHGPDPEPEGNGQSGTYSAGATPRQPACSTTQRFRAILAIPPEGGNQTVAGVRDELARANGVFFHAAVESGSPGGADIRFACDSTGQVAVHVLRMSTANSVAGFNTIMQEVTAEASRQGWSTANEKYFIYYDGRPGTTGAGGQGTLRIDDSDSAANRNNAGNFFAISFDSTFGTALHEMGHNLGAVQPGAPLATGSDAGLGNWGHCYESFDVMCYNDGGSTDPGYLINNCPDFDHFDCRHDSYFDAKIGAGQGGVAGSYIDTHWNIGDCVARFVSNAACGGDTTAPVAAAPVQSIASAAQLGTGEVPVRLTWSGADSGGSGIASYSLWQSTDGQAFTQISLPAATTTSAIRMLAPGHSYRFVVGAVDGAGNRSQWAYGPTFAEDVHQETSTAIAYTGTWARFAWAPAFGGYQRTSSNAGATATFSFTGRNVAWVAPTAVNRGLAYVYVDGAYVKTLDLYTSTTIARRVVYSRNWAASGAHTVKIQVLGTSGRPSVDVDAFAVLR